MNLKTFFIIHFAFLIALTACTPTESPLPAPPPGNLVPATVVKVIDGDTIDVQLNGQTYRVRYVLVNTPETSHSPGGAEPFGEEASAANRALVEGKTVQLEKDVSETDRYGRLLRYVYVDGKSVNEELLRQGMAHVATFPPDVKYVERFLAVQKEAQAAKRGIWADYGTLEITAVDVRAEVVTLHNVQNTAQSLDGWTLVSERGNQRCPLRGTLAAGESVQVWAQSRDVANGGINCGFSEGIWSNSNPDPAVLLDPAGLEVYRVD